MGFNPFENDGNGGGSVLILKNITENGHYSAADEGADGYSSVHIEVPNTYVAGDEGKVVSNGTLVTQTSELVTKNSIVDTTTISSLTVDVPRNGYQHGGVNFFDVDGTVLYAYTPEEFLELQEMPPNPDRTWEYLVAQGWNWTLADAKEYVTAYGALNVGQHYITPDDKTAIDVILDEGCLNPQLGLYVNGSVLIEWGDGTTDTLTGNSTNNYVYATHTYAEPGEYYILLTVTGKAIIKGQQKLFCKAGVGADSASARDRSKKYINSIQDVHLGANIDIGQNAFYRCYSMKHVSIPSTVASINSSTFQYCTSMEAVVIPHGTTSLGNSTFEGCYGLRFVSIPKTLTSIGTKCFLYCYSIIALTFPVGMTTVGEKCFSNMPSCDVINIPGVVGAIPDYFADFNRTMMSITFAEGVTSIGDNAFNECHGIKYVTLPSTLKSIGDNVFKTCGSLNEITFPDKFETFGIATFANDTALQRFTIPPLVTEIPESMFDACNSLSTIVIPDKVTNIGEKAFYRCYGLSYIKFESQIPPTIANADAFGELPTDCIIYVPEGTLTDYQTAYGYPSPGTYTYIEY